MLCQQKNEIKSEKIKPHRALQSIFGFWGVKLPGVKLPGVKLPGFKCKLSVYSPENGNIWYT